VTPLTHYSPLERSSGGIKLLQLDKDDAEALGLIKLDLLGLRMLAALERAREEVLRLEGHWVDLDDLPDDPTVWRMISEGATMGLFQIESPSQVHTSRVMRSRTMQDLAHQIALIRPGPIQSGTVHPYLRRRNGLETVRYWHPSLEPILAKTYGVLLFQEDVLRIAVHFAGMTWIEADRFRKKVSGFRDIEDIEPDRVRFVEGAIAHVGAHVSRPRPSSTPSSRIKATASPSRTHGRSRSTRTHPDGCASTTRQSSWPRS
jgi:error-prone DNA polymerase